MIELYFQKEAYSYDTYHIAKAMYSNEQITQTVDTRLEMVVQIIKDGVLIFSISEEELVHLEDVRTRKKYLIRRLYKALSEQEGKEIAWGILTGIRPSKILMKELEHGKSEEEVLEYMKKDFLVTEKKAKLALEIAQREKALLEQLDYQDGYSIYIGIPFCPTNCVYCSFTSYPLLKWKDKVDAYLDVICKELDFFAKVSDGKVLNTIYIGGGTPTTLEPNQLDRLLSHLEKNFSYQELKEITVEAGRPDSITKEKLQVLRNYGISRISINPQSMQQKTLDKIGRNHTTQDIVRTVSMAREMGFDNINMDLIAGLPGEDRKDMKATLEEVKKLNPDNLTVHALAIKRASRLGQMAEKEQKENQSEVLESMIDMAAEYAQDMGMVPYYLYRQKNIAGNFENVGYAKVDKAGIYNILIMEEKQTILAAGAGAITKIVRDGQIIRIENVKELKEYMQRIDEMIERKEKNLWQ